MWVRRATSSACAGSTTAMMPNCAQPSVRSRGGELFCPHTATAVKVLQDLRARGAKGDWAVVATAHPAKFEAVVEPLIGAPVAVPPALGALLQRPAHAEPLAADYAALREVLLR
ncbi:hypothetical protein G6F65_022353 [Rhizopus arrhizus]|nr:hypothetical protein G6F65_022353 [Rhizopus arrhizus]